MSKQDTKKPDENQVVRHGGPDSTQSLDSKVAVASAVATNADNATEEEKKKVQTADDAEPAKNPNQGSKINETDKSVTVETNKSVTIKGIDAARSAELSDQEAADLSRKMAAQNVSHPMQIKQRHVTISDALREELEAFENDLPDNLKAEYNNLFENIVIVEDLPEELLPPGRKKPLDFFVAPGERAAKNSDGRYWPNRFAVNPFSDHALKSTYSAGDRVYCCHDDKSFFVLSEEQQSTEWQARNNMPRCNLIDILSGNNQ